VTLILGLFLVFAATAPALLLEQFPLKTSDGVLIADENTKFITLFKQDAATKLITATIQIKNGGLNEIAVQGVGIEISFNEKVAPYSFNTVAPELPAIFGPGKSYVVDGGVFQATDFAKYCKPLLEGFRHLGAQFIQRDAVRNVIGAKYSCSDEKDTLKIAPGQTVDLIEFYFIPVNGADELNIDIFSYQYVTDEASLIGLTTYILHGTNFLLATESYAKLINPAPTYFVNPQSFKLHVQRPQPIGLSANNGARMVSGYDANTMEWSYDAAGPYNSGAPVVIDAAHNIYVRTKGDSAYSGNDLIYQNYKMYVPSIPLAIAFEDNSFEAKPLVTKVGVNNSSKDGKTRVGDAINYTITVKNIGEAGSIWANAVLTDTLPDGLFFAGNVALDGFLISIGPGGYTFINGLLTVPLGDIAANTVKVVTFTVEVKHDAYGKDITNSVTVKGKDGKKAGAPDLEITVKETGDDRVVESDQLKSNPPTVNTVTEGDREITGAGVPGADITVILPDESEINTKVGNNGKWTAPIPADKELNAGDEIEVVQIERGKTPSDPVEELVKAKVTVTFNLNGGNYSGVTTPIILNLTIGNTPGNNMPGNPSRASNTFLGWNTLQDGNGVVFDSKTPVATDITVYAQWKPITDTGGGGGGGGGGDQPIAKYKVTFDGNGGSPSRTEKEVNSGSSLGNDMPSEPKRDGYTFDGWNTQADGRGAAFTSVTKVTKNMTVYAQWVNGAINGGTGGKGDDITNIFDAGPPLAGFLAEHIPYISGYPDNSMRPQNAITRAEVSMIFFRLLSSAEKNNPRTSIFGDVANDAWYAQAVNYLASIEILTGYPDGTFKPNQPITRAEFAAVCSRFDNLAQTSSNAFPDVEGHWAKDYINSAYAKGWVSGYPEGNFKPQQNITRAEVVKVVNTMLNRKIHLEDIPEGIKKFTDIEGHWAYTEIVEACNDHDYTRKSDGYELWTLK